MIFWSYFYIFLLPFLHTSGTSRENLELPLLASECWAYTAWAFGPQLRIRNSQILSDLKKPMRSPHGGSKKMRKATSFPSFIKFLPTLALVFEVYGHPMSSESPCPACDCHGPRRFSHPEELRARRTKHECSHATGSCTNASAHSQESGTLLKQPSL